MRTGSCGSPLPPPPYHLVPLLFTTPATCHPPTPHAHHHLHHPHLPTYPGWISNHTQNQFRNTMPFG